MQLETAVQVNYSNLCQKLLDNESSGLLNCSQPEREVKIFCFLKSTAEVTKSLKKSLYYYEGRINVNKTERSNWKMCQGAKVPTLY